jgi:hypothetical protein
MTKKIKLWNGRGVDNKSTLYIGAHSLADACQMLKELYPGQSWNYELTKYFHKGCWGNNMDDLATPERGVWEITDEWSAHPIRERLYPIGLETEKVTLTAKNLDLSETEFTLKEESVDPKCECRVERNDENAPCYENKHTIVYCPLHASAADLLETLGGVRPFCLGNDTLLNIVDIAIGKARSR